jgi:hypothetical protein
MRNLKRLRVVHRRQKTSRAAVDCSISGSRNTSFPKFQTHSTGASGRATITSIAVLYEEPWRQRISNMRLKPGGKLQRLRGVRVRSSSIVTRDEGLQVG